MKAIETEYNGFKFRSRLEARWAVFLDCVGIKWTYEPEGYVLNSGGYYLPDFFLPETKIWNGECIGCFLEVKPEINNVDDKWELFSRESDYPIILIGNIPYPYLNPSDYYSGDFYWYQSKNACDGPYVFCECTKCGKVGLQFDGRSARIDCVCNSDSDKEYNYDSAKLVNAYKTARQARFEHGEYPLV